MQFNQKTENINYVKITYKDKEGFAHCIKAAVRFMSEYELLACAKIEDVAKIETPQQIELSIACDNGLYKSKATLNNVENENSYILFSIRKPEDMEYQQKREYFRVKLNENTNIIYETEKGEEKLSALIYDISANGVRIELDERHDFPSEVQLLLFLPNRIVNTQAKYVRTDDEDNILKASFNFVNILQADIDYISQICFQKQLEERRKNLS